LYITILIFQGKAFHNIRKGLGLSVLALISVMVGVTVFRAPMHGLHFKKPTTTIETITNTLLKSRWISSNDTVLKVNKPQLQHNHRNRNVRQRLSSPTYQPPRRL